MFTLHPFTFNPQFFYHVNKIPATSTGWTKEPLKKAP
jgi:hypothetical protein